MTEFWREFREENWVGVGHDVAMVQAEHLEVVGVIADGERVGIGDICEGEKLLDGDFFASLDADDVYERYEAVVDPGER